MEDHKPIRLYFLVTFLLLLALLVIGLKFKEYLDKKYPAQPAVKNETKPKERTDEFAIVDLALGIALALILLAVIVRVMVDRPKRT